MNSKAKAIFIVGLLAVLSLGTVYFSKMGVDFRKKQLSELSEDYGQVNFASDYGYYNIIPSTLSGKVGVVSFIFNKDDIDQAMIQLSRIHEQFNAREDVLLVTHVVREPTDTLTYIDQIFERNGLVQDLAQWVVSSGDTEMLQSLGMEGYHIKAEQMAYPLHLIVDPDGVIRRYYNADEPEEVRQLIRHVTTLLPRVKEADIKVKR